MKHLEAAVVVPPPNVSCIYLFIASNVFLAGEKRPTVKNKNTQMKKNTAAGDS